MKRIFFVRCVLCVMICVSLVSVVNAAIEWNGDVSPEDPSIWEIGTSPYSCHYVGQTTFGSVTVSSGDEIASMNGYLGYDASSTGQVTIDGSGSAWRISDRLYVGEYGNGALEITNGGMVTSEFGRLGHEDYSMGKVTVEGVGSTWNNDYALTVGYCGTGRLEIKGGGTVSTGYATVGYFEPGEVIVDGIGSTWTNGCLTIGLYICSDGSLKITNGGTVRNSFCTIGDSRGSRGQVTVDGNGSAWENKVLYVGDHGNATLRITNGGVVTVSEDTYLLSYRDAQNKIEFNHGVLTTGGLCANFDDLIGTGSIETGGLVSDVDLVFDETNDLSQTWTLSNPTQNMVIDLNVDGSGSMGAGCSGSGTMQISNGVVIESNGGYLGYQSGSSGVATVSGIGSKWTNSSTLYVGLNGSGTLVIANGGLVRNNRSSIGDDSYSTGLVTVSGSESTWVNDDELRVGRLGNGLLEITDGGLVSVAGELYIDSTSGFINMSAGGMLALNGGEHGPVDEMSHPLGRLSVFFDLIRGSDAVRWWDDTLGTAGDWASLTTATEGTDYTLEYLTEGDLAGYTLLTVIAPGPVVPEPSMIAMLCSLLAVGVLFASKRYRC